MLIYKKKKKKKKQQKNKNNEKGKKQEQRTCCLVDFSVSADNRDKNKIKRKDKETLGPCLRTKADVGHEGIDDTNCNSNCNWNFPKKFGRKKGGFGYQRKNCKHYWGRPKYWEESWRPEDTRWHSY